MVLASILQEQTGFNIFNDENPYHTETSPLICTANQWIYLFLYDRDLHHERLKTKSKFVLAQVTKAYFWSCKHFDSKWVFNIEHFDMEKCSKWA